ncbi:MAG TPA: PAS domain S-box protein, partial [bacterium]|nr:PAS domain S-box protein [bacterium]
MGGFDIGAVADYFWFALFTALIAVAVLAHRRTVFFHPWPLFIGLSFLWIYGLLNLIDKVPSLRTVPILGIGGIHNVLHDFIFPFFGSLTSISALIWETISRSYHVKDISSRVEQLFNNIISNSPEAVVVYDLRNCVTLWNDEAERLFGYSREEVLGREIWDELVTPEFRGRQIDVWNYLKSKGPIVDYPTPMVSRDQKSLGLRASVFPVKDEKGEIIGRVSIYRRSEEETQLAFWVGSFRSSLDMRRGLRELSGHLRIMVPHDE